MFSTTFWREFCPTSYKRAVAAARPHLKSFAISESGNMSLTFLLNASAKDRGTLFSANNVTNLVLAWDTLSLWLVTAGLNTKSMGADAPIIFLSLAVSGGVFSHASPGLARWCGNGIRIRFIRNTGSAGTMIQGVSVLWNYLAANKRLEFRVIHLLLGYFTCAVILTHGQDKPRAADQTDYLTTTVHWSRANHGQDKHWSRANPRSRQTTGCGPDRLFDNNCPLIKGCCSSLSHISSTRSRRLFLISHLSILITVVSNIIWLLRVKTGSCHWKLNLILVHVFTAKRRDLWQAI